jgi:hypothetical protein
MKYFYNENYETLKKEIEEDTRPSMFIDREN